MKTLSPAVILVLAASHLAAVLLSYQWGRHEDQAGPGFAEFSPRSILPERREGRISSPPEGGGLRFHPSTATTENGGFSQRLQSLWNETASMDAAEVLSSLHHLRFQPDGADKLLAEQALLARYAEVDPETALTYVARLGGLNHELGSLTVMSSWASRDPENAGAYFEAEADEFGILDENQRETAGAIAAEWAAQDLESAMHWVDGLSEDVQGEAYRRIMAQTMAAGAPQAALALLDSVPRGLDQREMMETLADQWAHQDPEAATAWLGSLDPQDQIAAMPHLMASWMQSNPMNASTWLANEEDGAVKDRGIVAMTQSSALRRDPEAAVAWSTAIQDPNTRAQSLKETASRWLQLDPVGARTWLGQWHADP